MTWGSANAPTRWSELTSSAASLVVSTTTALVYVAPSDLVCGEWLQDIMPDKPLVS
jgi:hypothetical protein